ncbi:unnamed protein product [Medioppia subpectinata]|uniref:Uncharacterized protein n=1 Tax=Medioppia subpectinata TaxID=1979941 RepID=A0A7R9PZ71_9ACAR|nr:unnamed protein product [Medioppia subpectinata]CAG2106786.1 unnamed protein product [Medioppia subpectinata]
MTKSIDLNRELILDELSNFEAKKSADIPDLLNQYLESIAQNGDPLPSKHYKRTDKFMRGIEKNILVVSTIEPLSANGSSTSYATSSFKNLFMHSSNSFQSTASLSSASSSLLVNGMADVLCDNQMSSESSLKALSGPISPTSLPLSPTTGSPPNPNHTTTPLQQLDSFTAVFASSPSTNPLSVVYPLSDSPNSSPLITSLTSEDNCLLSTTTTTTTIKPIETSTDFETTVNPELDSLLISSTSSSSLGNTSTDITPEIKTDFVDNNSNHEINETKHLKSNETISSSKIDEELPQTSYAENIEPNNNVITDKIDETVVTDAKAVTSSDGSPEDKTIVTSFEKTEIIKTDTTSTPVETIACDMGLNEQNESLVPELMTDSPNNKTVIESTDNNSEMRTTPEDDASQPMDFCGSNGNADNNSTDITDLSDKNTELSADLNKMDETVSHSDQSEPMDED